MKIKFVKSLNGRKKDQIATAAILGGAAFAGSRMIFIAAIIKYEMIALQTMKIRLFLNDQCFLENLATRKGMPQHKTMIKIILRTISNVFS